MAVFMVPRLRSVGPKSGQTPWVNLDGLREDQLPGLLNARHASAPLSYPPQDEATTLLPNHVSQNIEAIRILHIRADESLSRYHRPIETVSSLLGRPAFFYGIVLFVTLWVLLNVLSP